MLKSDNKLLTLVDATATDLSMYWKILELHGARQSEMNPGFGRDAGSVGIPSDRTQILEVCQENVSDYSISL